MSSPRYVLDANVFIHAHRQHYPFDVVPAFWTFLLRAGASGAICSIDRIHGELKKMKDEVTDWATDHFHGHFRSTDDPTLIAAYRKVVAAVQANPQYTVAAKARFMSGEDGWLIAFAMANKCIVVTHEVSAPDSKTAIKIPDVCAPFGVTTVNTVSMLRALGAKFG